MDNEELLMKMAKLDEKAKKKAKGQDRRWQSTEEKHYKERIQHKEQQTQQMMMLSGK